MRKQTNYRVAILSFIIIVAIFFSCENDLEVVKSITETYNLPKQSAENIEIIYSDSAKVQIKIIGPKLEVYLNEEDEPYYEFQKGIKVYFYNPDLSIRSKLTANYAIYNVDEKEWEARGNVVVINENGRILKTEQLFWGEEKKKIYTNKLVKAIDDKSEIHSVGFEADENLDSWEFKNVTRSYFTVEK